MFKKIFYTVSDYIKINSLEKFKKTVIYLILMVKLAFFFYVVIPNNQKYFIFSSYNPYSISSLKVSLSTIDIINDDSSEKKTSEIFWNIITFLMVACCCVLCCICFKCYKCEDSSSSSLTHFNHTGDTLVFMKD